MLNLKTLIELVNLKILIELINLKTLTTIKKSREHS